MTSLAPPALDQGSPPSAPAQPRRRWIPWVAAYLSCALIAGLSWAGFGLANYSPVGFAGGGSFVDEHPTQPRPSFVRTFPKERLRADKRDKSMVTLDDSVAGSHSAYIVTFTRGREFSFGFDFTNSGRWGVTVIGIPLHLKNHPYFVDTGVYMSLTEGDRLVPPPVVPLKPFALAPGHSRWIEVRFRFRDCGNVQVDNAHAGYSSFDTFPVSFRFLGLTRHEDFKLPETLAIKAGGSGCA